MLPDELTLTIDPELDGQSTTEAVFTRYEEDKSKSTYISSAHTVASRDQLQFYRTFPKQNGNFRGVQKATIKFTKDAIVDGVNGDPVVAPLIIEVNFSIPVGYASADVAAVRSGLVSLFKDEIEAVGNLCNRLEI